jgi:hypothetical protein
MNGNGCEFGIMKQFEENHWIVGEGVKIYQYRKESKYYTWATLRHFRLRRDSKVLVILHMGKQVSWHVATFSILPCSNSPDLNQRPSGTKYRV